MENQNLNGVGLGLRAVHYSKILTTKPKIPFFEVLADNYLISGGLPLYNLKKIAEIYPLTMHSVSMSIGSTAAINFDYLKQLKKLYREFKPVFISDHLCFCSDAHNYVPDLLPLPYTEEAINHVVNRIKQIQDFFAQKILIENVSTYLEYKDSKLPEWEFLNTIAKEADCNILLDINNIYVSAYNNDFSAEQYLNNIDIKLVKQLHLAGYSDKKTHLLDTHGENVHPPVWQLYAKALNRFGKLPTIIEWDSDIPPLQTLLEERQIALKYYNNEPSQVTA